MSENKNEIAIKSGFWYTISNFLLKGISFITIPIFSRLLTHEQFGQYNNFYSWLQILTIFITMNVKDSLISAKYDFKDKFDQYVLSIFSLNMLTALAWATVLNIGNNFFERFTNLTIFYINCMVIYIFFYAAFILFQMRERFLFKYKASVGISVLNAFASALLSVILVLVCSDKLKGRIIGSIIPVILIGSVIILFLVKKGKKIDFSCWKYALKVCIPHIPHRLSLIMLGSMDRIMITKICGAETTALYSLAYSCGFALSIVLDSLNGAYGPWLGDNLHEKNYKNIRKVSKWYISIFVYIALGMMLLIPEVLLIMGGKSYLEAKFVLAPVALGCIYQFLYTLFVNIEQAKKKTTQMAFATVFAAGLNYVLNYIFIRKFGYIAAAYTTVVGYISLLIAHMFIVNKLGYKDVYDNKFIIYVAIITFIITILVNLLYQNDVIRYIVFGIYVTISLTILIKYKDNVLKLVKIFRKK